MNPKLLGAFLVGIIVLTGVYIGSLTLKQPSTENIILDQQAQVGGSMPSGQVSYWNFDAGSGSGASDSVGNNTLSFVGSPTWVAGRFGQALSFSGTGAGLRDSSVSVSSSAVTAAFWLKNDSWGTSQTELIELSDNNNNSTSGFGIYANDTPSCSSGQISVVIKGDAGYNAACYATPGAGVWHHYGFVLDKSQGATGEIKVYMDGALQTASKQLFSSNNTNSFSTNSLNVMTRSGEGSPTFAGIMDDLRFYSKALSSNEIGQLISYTGEPTVPIDTTAPVISAVSTSNVTTTGVTISWITDEASDTQIEYGHTTAYGSNTTLNSSLSTSHSQSLSGLQSGTLYHYRLKSRDAANNLGVSADQTFTTTAAANQAPTVSLALSATSVTAPGTVTLTASASDPDGSIARVEFYNGSARLDNDTTSPYTFTWSNIPVGTYTVSALAYDNKGLTGVSTLKTITVGTQPQSTYTVNVTKAGTGSGTVTSTGSINCGLTCSSTGNSGQSVTLTATPATGSTFSGWSGGTCSGTASTCTFTLNSNKTITASFTGTPITYSVTVTKSGAGSGTVTSTGSINCGTSCTANGTPGQTVTLTATPATGSTFAGWSGILGCSTSTTCSFNLNANTTINAIFNTAVSTYTVTTAKAGTGSGTVTCNPTSCSATTGGTVTVTATPSPGSIFLGWTGGCTGTGSCSLTSTGTVTATFNYIPQVDGTTFYVTPSGAGAKNGSDWNNAYGSLPATLVRGATYYLAGGSYSSYTFNTPESGTKVITIKKASPADHGTDAGWVSSYGTTQATFTSQFRVHRGNFVLDGQYRNENDWFDGLAYGLKIKHNNDFTHLIIRDENGTRNVNNVTIKYLYIAAQIGVLGSRPYAIDTDTYSSVIRNSGYVFSHDYVEGSNNPYFVRNTIDPLIEYSASSKTSGDAQYHGEVVNRFYSSNGVRGGGVIRYNHFRDSYNGASGYPKGGGTGVIAISETSGAEIYGNIFERYYVGDGAIAAGWANNNIKVYNNTFIDGVQGSGALVRFTATGAIVSGNVANNNLAINTANTTYNGDGTFDFNGTAPTTALINYAGGDYRLSQPTSITGRSLPSPFNLDRTGTIRGSVGIWDIGAYEYTGTAVTPSSYTLSVTRSGNVAGSVSGAGVTCTTTSCNTVTVAIGTSATLTATAPANTTIVWTGCSTAVGNTCTIAANSVTAGNVKLVNADFSAITVTQPSMKFTSSPPDRVISTVAGLNVRSSPSTSASSLGLQNLNALGTILSNVSNGVYANGYYWWNINYDSPATGCVVTSTQNCKVGWSAENYLIKYDTPTTYTVTTAKAGTGSGTVTCNPTSCSATTGSSVTISAVPSAGSTFLGWSGCTSVAGNSCTKSAAGTVTATFNVIPVVGLTYTVTKGTMTNGTFSCNPASCTQNAGATITLTANPASGYQFSSWSGCTSITDTCTAYGAANVVATFIPRPTSVGNACSGTCYYVTVSGNGAKNGSDWNNAYAFSNVTSGTYQGLASSNMKRGATYYFATGSYPAMALDDVEDGTKWIKIHKATAANSGNIAGWTVGLGNQANIGYIALASDYYEIDGQTRNESKWNDDASYGFKTTSIIAHWDNFKPGADNIVIKNTSIGGKLNKPMTDTDFASGINVEGGPGGRSGYTIVNNYIHDTATPIWFSSGSNGFTIENNFIGASRGKEAIMGIYGGYNVIVRNNILVDNCQDNPYSTTANGCSAEITGFSASGQFNFDNWEVSGNLITRKNAKTTDHSDAAIAGGGTSSVTGWKVFNNVISSMYGAGLNRVHVKISAGGNNTAYNNVWYDIGGNGLTQTGCVATTCTNNITVTTDPYRYLSPAIKNQLPL